MKTIFAENLKRIRKERNISQSDLAIISGCANIAHFETGKRIPSLKNLFNISKALHVTLDELVGEQRGVGLFDGLKDEQINTILQFINFIRMNNK